MAINGALLDYATSNTTDSDFKLSLAQGHVPRSSFTYKFGKATDIGTGGYTTLWEEGGNYVTPTSATTASIVSSSTADAAAGTGARTVQISGLDANYVVQSEIVTMNGTTPVVTTNTYIRLNRMATITAGSGNDTAGTITATVDSVVTCSIVGEENQSHVAHYTIPADTYGYVNQMQFGVGSGKEVEIQVKVRSFGGVYRTVAAFFDYQSSQNITLDVPLEIAPKSDVQIVAKASAGSAISVDATIAMILVQDEM
jgi:hypothetical protein